MASEFQNKDRVKTFEFASIGSFRNVALWRDDKDALLCLRLESNWSEWSCHGEKGGNVVQVISTPKAAVQS